MIIQSTRLGQLEVASEEIVSFPQGLPGFPNEKAFVLLPHQPGSPFAFLQSVLEPDLTFLNVEPFIFFNDYEFELNDELVREVGLSDDNPPQIFNIVTISEKTEEMTANLLAPLIINIKKRLAVQIILEKTPYTVRHRLFPDGLPKQVEKGGGE